MSTLLCFTDKTKGFFERITRRPHSRHGNRDLTKDQDEQSERGLPVDTRDNGAGPLPSILVDDTTTSAPSSTNETGIHPGTQASFSPSSIHSSSDPILCRDFQESVVVIESDVQNPLSPLNLDTFHHHGSTHSVGISAEDSVRMVHGLLLLPSPVMSPRSTSDTLASPPTPSTQVLLHDPPSPLPAPLLDAKPNTHALQTANQNPRSLPSSPYLLATPVRSPRTLYSAPSYFSNASGFSIGQVNANSIQNFASPKTIFEYLEHYVSHGAAYNSSKRCDAPKCDPETRRAIQEDVFSWMRNGDIDGEPKKIMWLAGPAGSGKTAIAGSVAETCEEGGFLAATFFFSSFTGSADRHSKRFVVATIALHLSEHDALYDYKVQLQASIERNPTIFHKRLVDQAHCLLLQPLRAIREQTNTSAWPKDIILDGLDEVLVDQGHDQKKDQLERTHEDDQLEILNILFTLAKDPAFPFRIFIPSRPERVIDELFSTTAKSLTVKLFLDSKYDPDADIRRFLHSKFASIRRRFGMSNPLWPGQEAVDRIVEMSSGQFIVPATIVRHIGAGVPQRQLDDIMQLKWEDAGRRNPFAALDALYTYILHRSPEPFLAAKWIRVYTSLTEPISALYFKQLFEDVEGEFRYVLGPLSSLISIPTTGDSAAPLMVYHKSLGDYLASQHRSGNLYLSGSSAQAFVAARCVRVLKSKGPAVPVLHSSNDWAQFLHTHQHLVL